MTPDTNRTYELCRHYPVEGTILYTTRHTEGHMTFEDIYNEHHDRIAGYFRASLLDMGRADELTSDTFLTLHEKLSEGISISPDKVGNWLIVVAKNHLRNDKKRLARRREDLVSPDYLETIEDEERIIDFFGSPPAVTLEDAEFRADFDHALRELPPQERDAFILTELRGLTVREASSHLDLGKTRTADLAEAARLKIRAALS